MEFDAMLFISQNAVTESRKRNAEHESQFEVYLKHDFYGPPKSDMKEDYYSDEEDEENMLITYENKTYLVPIEPIPNHKDIRALLNKKHHKASGIAYEKSKKSKREGINLKPKYKSKRKEKGVRKFSDLVREYFYWY
jgi:hypothetical protein